MLYLIFSAGDFFGRHVVRLLLLLCLVGGNLVRSQGKISGSTMAAVQQNKRSDDAMVVDESTVIVSSAGLESTAIVPTSAGLSRLESMKYDNMRIVLELADFQMRIRMSGSSKTLERLICREHSWLWEKLNLSPHGGGPLSLDWTGTATSIHMGRLGKKIRKETTDEQLRRFFLKINARDVTKQLCMNGFCNVDGSFLQALSGSAALERFEMKGRYFNQKKLNIQSMIVSLETMAPFVKSVESRSKKLVGLRTIILPEKETLVYGQRRNVSFLDRYDDKTRAFYTRFESKLRNVLVAYKTPCKGGNILMDHTFPGSPKELFCKDCNNFCCGDKKCKKCPSWIKWCEKCQATHCGWCHELECDECLRDICPGCNFLMYCQECCQGFCEDCTRVEICNGCDARRCIECLPEENYTRCREFYSGDCDEMCCGENGCDTLACDHCQGCEYCA